MKALCTDAFLTAYERRQQEQEKALEMVDAKIGRLTLERARLQADLASTRECIARIRNNVDV